MVRVVQFVLIALILGTPAAASAGPAEDANAALIGGRLLIARTIQKSSPRVIGRMRFFSALSVLSFPRGLRRS